LFFHVLPTIEHVGTNKCTNSASPYNRLSSHQFDVEPNTEPAVDGQVSRSSFPPFLVTVRPLSAPLLTLKLMSICRSRLSTHPLLGRFQTGSFWPCDVLKRTWPPVRSRRDERWGSRQRLRANYLPRYPSVSPETAPGLAGRGHSGQWAAKHACHGRTDRLAADGSGCMKARGQERRPRAVPQAAAAPRSRRSIRKFAISSGEEGPRRLYQSGI
jgi:hypothetical protein